jgi:hypothetical protein
VSDERRETQVTTEEEEEDEEEKIVVFERLFSNLNQSTLKRESGSLSSAIFLVAGTTVGAGILAIPAVTQESGFLASAVACILCWAFMVMMDDSSYLCFMFLASNGLVISNTCWLQVVTGLLVAEVNVNTMSELGSGGVSLVSMAKRTLGSVGVQVVS